MTRIPIFPKVVRGADHPWLQAAAFAAATLQPTRAGGQLVTDQRTSWVRRVATRYGDVFVKVYEYDTWAARLRGGARRTAPWRRSRAAAEFDALAWLRQHGLVAPEPVAAGEVRRLGFLVRSVLVTTAFAGEPIDALLPSLAPGDRLALADTLGTLVGRLHALGFRDRNLDLRNLLAQRRSDGGWTIAKIDSPRHRLVAPGRRDDALARADWARLLPQLAPFDLADATRAAAERA